MKIVTRFAGLELQSPFVAGASPLAADLDTAAALAEAGVGALVVHSLFEEELRAEGQAIFEHLDAYGESFGEATSFLPPAATEALGPDEYLEHVRRLVARVPVPVFGSLNGTTRGGWLEHATRIEEAGAAGLELNVYDLITDLEREAGAVENDLVALVEEVRRKVRIPLVVKLSPFFTALPNLARRLGVAGADGLVLFNRFYQPDIDPDELEVEPSLQLSDPSELRLRLRWLAVLSGRVDADLAVSGGVHHVDDAIKALLAGAHAVQMVSALLRNGPNYVTHMVEGLLAWMDEREYEDLAALRGAMDLTRCPDPRAYERANYIKVLRSWSPDAATT